MGNYDSVVVGGGFYGCCIALYLRRCGHHVLLLEGSKMLLSRASFVNQARIHQGYHYPRSIVTGLRSRANVGRFMQDFSMSADTSFKKLYAIANVSSKVSANQFVQFCHRIGAPLRPARPEYAALFAPSMVEAVFEVEEGAFDANQLRVRLTDALRRYEVDVRFEAPVQRIQAARGGKSLDIILVSGATINTPHVWNCTYAFLNRLLHQSDMPLLPLKHEVTELCLVNLPAAMQNLGVTVMDGPFFSTMPYPAAALHSLSHVRFTPRESWQDVPKEPCRDPYLALEQAPRGSWFAPMLKDAARYLPPLVGTKYVKSLYEIKTVLLANETDDGRPILFRRDHGLPNHFLALGGKIDNIYDFFAAVQKSGAVQATGRFDYSAQGLF